MLQLFELIKAIGPCLCTVGHQLVDIESFGTGTSSAAYKYEGHDIALLLHNTSLRTLLPLFCVNLLILLTKPQVDCVV